MTPSPPDDRPRRRPLGRLLVAALATLLLAEVAVRLLTAVAMTDYAPAAIRERTAPPPATGSGAGASADGTEYGVVPHPYLGYVERTGATLAGVVDPDRLVAQVGSERPAWLDLPVNEVGFVDPSAYPFDHDEDDYVVVVLGGSVARWFALQGGETFRARLMEDPRLAGRDVVLVCAAVGGYKQPQQVMALAWLSSLGLRFDAAVNLDGLNEVSLAAVNVTEGVSPAFPSAAHWAHVVAGDAPDAAMRRAMGELERARDARDAAAAAAHRWTGLSNLVGLVCARRAEAHAAEVALLEAELADLGLARAQAADAGGLAGPRADGDLDVQQAELLAVWERGSRTLAALCAGRGAHYLHLLQPTSHDWADGPAKPFTHEELAAIGPRGEGHAWSVEQLYPRLRERLAALAADGVAARDLSRVFADEPRTLYYDLAHVNQLGNELLAARAAEQFLASLP